jgi:predicted transcriptional regulator
MSPEARSAADSRAAELDLEMDLAEIRRARLLSQEEIAQTLHIGQSSVARLEKRADMYVSTLRRFVEAMGGELEIVARFPDHTVTIRNFSDLSEKEAS